MLSLRNVTTGDVATAATELTGPKIVRLDFDVANAAIFYQLGEGWPGVTWGPAQFKTPARDALERRCTGIRVWSAARGVPAQVTVDAVQEWDVADG